MAGMLAQSRPLQSNDDRPRVAITMLGNTTKAVMTIRDALARHGLDSVIFHSNGVGGPAMEELAADGLFVGVIDFTTDELADELVGGFHVGGPDRLRRIGRLGLPQVVVPGCIDFTVHGRPEEVPARLAGRPIYTHNPEFTLVRTLAEEMIALGRVFAERLNEATRAGRGHGADAGAVDSQRPRRRVLGSGGRRRRSSTSCGRVCAPTFPSPRTRSTSTPPNSRWRSRTASSRSRPGKERPHDRARPRGTAVEQSRRPRVSGHPGVPEAVRSRDGADGEHRAARAASAALDRYRHGDTR